MLKSEMNIQFIRLIEVNSHDIIVLNTHPLVLRHMPLANDTFNEKQCQLWVKEKENQWKIYGYGPWAFTANGEFAGWGGLQYEDGDADLALVLHPTYWGIGRKIYNEIIKRAFCQMAFESVTILLPPVRTRIKGIFRLGFEQDGEITIGGKRFTRYRLYK